MTGLHIVVIWISICFAAASTQCTGGWLDLGFQGKCYRFVNKRLDWISALLNCQQLSARLLEPNEAGRDVEHVTAGLLTHGFLLNYNTAWVGARLEDDGVLRWLNGQEIGRPRSYNKGLVCGAIDLEGPLVRSCATKLPSVCVKDVDLPIETTVPTTTIRHTHSYTDESKETYKTNGGFAHKDTNGTYAATREGNITSDGPTTSITTETITVEYERDIETGRVGANIRDSLPVALLTEKPISPGPTNPESGVLLNVIVGLGVAVVMLVVGLIACSFRKCRHKQYNAEALTEAMTKNSVSNIYEYIDDNTPLAKRENKSHLNEIDTSDTDVIQSATKTVEEIPVESTYDEAECVTREEVPQSKRTSITSTGMTPPNSARGRKISINRGDNKVNSSRTENVGPLNDADVNYIDMTQSPTIRLHERSGTTPYANVKNNAGIDVAISERPVEGTDHDGRPATIAKVSELKQLNEGYMDMTRTITDRTNDEKENSNNGRTMVTENAYQSNSFSIVIQANQ